MKIAGRTVSRGWLAVLLGIVAMSVIGLCYPYDGETFALGGDGALWANVAWMITATIFVQMMTPGLSFFCGGMVRKKNVISTMPRCNPI